MLRKSKSSRTARALVRKLDDVPVELRGRIAPWSPGIQSSWTPGTIRAALSQHEVGSFSESSKLVDAMGRDDRMTPILLNRTRGLLGLPLSWERADETPAAVQLAERWEKLLPTTAPSTVLARFLRDYVMLGVALMQIAWEQDEDEQWQTYLYNEDMQSVYWDEALGFYRFSSKEQGIVDIVPGDGRWVLLEAGDRGWMNGAVRALAFLWHISELTWFDWARYSERHGMPIVLAKHPAQIRDDARDAFWGDIVRLGRETSLLLPQGVGPNGEGFDAELLEAKDGSWEAFEKLKASADRSKAIFLLGQNLTTEVDAGSFAAASVHKNVKVEVLQADGGELSNCLYQQVVRPVSGLLVPDGKRLAPKPKWDTTPPENQKQRAEMTGAAANALASLVQLGAKIDLTKAASRFDLPLDPEQPLGQQLFMYHLTFGLVTVNEARARLGLPIVPDGDRIPQPVAAAGGEEEVQARAPWVALDAAKLSKAREVASEVETRAFVDEAADVVQVAGGESPLLGELLALIEGAADPEELRARIVAAYRDADPERVAETVERAIMLAELAGMIGVGAEVGEG